MSSLPTGCYGDKGVARGSKQALFRDELRLGSAIQKSLTAIAGLAWHHLDTNAALDGIAHCRIFARSPYKRVDVCVDIDRRHVHPHGGMGHEHGLAS